MHRGRGGHGSGSGSETGGRSAGSDFEKNDGNGTGFLQKNLGKIQRLFLWGNVALGGGSP